MIVEKSDCMPVSSSEDVVLVRQIVRKWAVELGFSLVEQTKMVTAASELARNAVLHGGGGQVRLEVLRDTRRAGLRLFFEDRGPGIGDINLAMQDGYSTAGGLGLGLSGARRLCNDFEISSALGQGTRVMIARWKG